MSQAFPRKTLEPSENLSINLFTHLNQLLVNYGFNCIQNWERTIKQYLTDVISILVRFFIGFCGKMRWKKPAEWGRRFLAAVSVSLWLLSTALYYIGCRSYIAQTKTAENCRRILMKNVHKVNAETTKNTTAFFLIWPGNRPSSSTIREVRFSARGKIGDVGERFAGDLALIIIGARRLTDLSPTHFS